MAFRFLQPVFQACRRWVRSGTPPGHGLSAHLQGVVAVAEVPFEHEPSSTLEHLAGQSCGFSRQAIA